MSEKQENPGLQQESSRSVELIRLIQRARAIFRDAPGTDGPVYKEWTDARLTWTMAVNEALGENDLESELVQAQADVEALSQGPWVVIEIGPLGFEQLLVRLETDRDNISTHYEGQVLAFAFSAGDMSKAFNTAWKDGRAIEKLRLTLATPRSSPAGG